MGWKGMAGRAETRLTGRGTRQYKARPNDGRDRWKVSIRPGVLLDAGGGGGLQEVLLRPRGLTELVSVIPLDGIGKWK